jgi:hypothetical protein
LPSKRGEPMTAAMHWVRDHDDRLSFVLFYIGGAIILSVWLNLFWVAMLMLAHFGLEILRGHLLKAERPLMHALWEVKLDVGLLLFALVVAIYSEHVLALLGLGQAARAGQAARGLQVAAKFGIVERALRILVLTMDDIARLVQAVIKFRNKSGQPATARLQAEAPDRSEASSPAWGDIFSLGFAFACLLLILLTPSLTGASTADVGAHLLQELSPSR